MRGISLWDATAGEADLTAPLEGGASTDLAIIGGGFTGLSTALHAAERGIDCHVLEARQIGFGGSGRKDETSMACLRQARRKGPS